MKSGVLSPVGILIFFCYVAQLTGQETQVADGNSNSAAAAIPLTVGAPAASVGNCSNSFGDIVGPQASELGRIWFSAEYLLWWTRHEELPPLVAAIPGSSATPGPTTAQVIRGITQDQVISPNSFNVGAASGVRFSGGGYVDAQGTLGVDASYFRLQSRSANSFVQSNGEPVIGPVYYAPILFTPVLIQESVPTFRSGAVDLGFTSRFWGTDANVRVQGVSIYAEHTDYLIGFRQAQLTEGFTQIGESTVLPPFPNANSTTTTYDNFATKNQFYGPQIGFSSYAHSGPCSVNLQVKLAMGCVHEEVGIQGATTLQTGALVVTGPGGVLALPSNIGQYTRNQFAVVPEVNLNFGYQVTSFMRVFLGYDFLCLSTVLRPAQQIDTNVNTFGITSLAYYNPALVNSHPQFQAQGQSYWAQGLNFGLELKY
jgi:Putative beta barrel porin-7 (BBP7)